MVTFHDRMTGPTDSSAIQLREARARVIAGEPVARERVPASLLASWQRAHAAGLLPGDRVLFDGELLRSEQRRIADINRWLIELADSEMTLLWQTIADPRRILLLTDAKGTIIHSLGNRMHAPRELKEPLDRGRRLGESVLGSNAPGIALNTRQAMVVQGDEHYLDELSGFNCAAAPIFRPNGELAGVLDISWLDAHPHPAMFRRVVRVARAIENRLFEAAAAEEPDTLLVHLHEDERFLGTPAEGLLWLREDGTVLGMNASARVQLDLSTSETEPADSALPLAADALLDAGTMKRLAARSGKQIIAAPKPGSGQRLHLALSQPRPLASRALAGATAQRSASDVALDARLQALFERASRVVPHRLPILVTGETGTGKEWFARRLHEAHRSGKPFIAVNCSALPETLAEAELFGYADGAFTGSRRGGAPGKFEQAQGGTLLLDEIGDMPLALQTRLLRVLEDRCLTRLGAAEEIELDVVIIAATHWDIPVLVKDGSFREDLWFRLSGFTVQLPPLRERSDLEAVIDQFIDQQGTDIDLPDALRKELTSYAWPGNLRQLRQTLEVACALAGPGGTITVEMLPEAVITTGDDDSRAAQDMRSVIQEHAKSVLAKHGGNMSATARELGISRTTLYKRLGDR